MRGRAVRTRLFASGFRPAFLAAGLAALLLIPLWVAVWGFGAPLASSWSPTAWHAHEMLFGFLTAAVAGFLLTAVPSWTGERGFAGRPLMLLMSLWLAGRVLIGTSMLWPPLLVAAVDIAFTLALIILLAPSLFRTRNRNRALLFVLSALAGCNLASHWAIAHRDPEGARHAVLIGIDLILLLVTIIGGRILPAFTNNALRSRGSTVQLRSWPGMSSAAILSMLAVAGTDLLHAGPRVSGAVAATAGVIQGVRLMQWRSLATLRQPIVWILHLGYLWLPVGLVLKSMAMLTGAAFSAFWLHSMTIGVLATMSLGVMTRASLGHTGRPLVVDPLITGSYLSLLAAAAIRVFGLAMAGMSYRSVILVSAACWTCAFALFLVVYVPIFLQPRVDGRPG